MNPYIHPFENYYSNATRILAHIKASGLKTEIRNGVLFVGPGRQINDDLRWLINDHKPELLALVAIEDEGVAWRAGSMLRQLSGLQWPCAIPTLFGLPNYEPNPEDCKSCGELLATGEGDSFICGVCARAKTLALESWMQRPAQSVRAA